jgi:phosphatidate cytidylyltransferase
MLRTRVITALVLVALLLPALFYLPQSYWALAVAAFIGVGAWEWGALLGWRNSSRLILGVATALICATLSWLDPEAIGAVSVVTPAKWWVLLIYGIAAVFWCLLVPLWLQKKWAIVGSGRGTGWRCGTDPDLVGDGATAHSWSRSATGDFCGGLDG